MSLEGIERHKEVSDGLHTMVVYFMTTKGLPFEFCKEKMDAMSLLEKTIFYINFRTKHPKLFV